MITVPLSPLSNPHESILRRRHLVDGECRTVPAQQRRRQSVAAMQSTTNKLPPTPCKSTVGRGHTRKRRQRIAKFTLSTHHHHHNNHMHSSQMKKHQTRHAKKITRTPASHTPSPPKKRKTLAVHSQFVHAQVQAAQLHQHHHGGGGGSQLPLQRNGQSHSCSQLPSLWSLASDNSESHLHRRSAEHKRRHPPLPPPPHANMPMAQKQRYFVSMGVIGVGSFSQVFKVQNFETKKLYALKKITTNLNHRDAISDALNEVEIMQQLQQQQHQQLHPHLICLRDFWISRDQHLFELYDYYEHGTLLDFVEHNARLNHLQILEITRQVCDGLRYVHSLNIIHLDLKPSNIYVTRDFTIKIGDFGISVRVNDKEVHGDDNGDDDDDDKLSHHHNKYRYSGDPIYIAPELMNFDRNLANITHKTDIFSLGIILLELLCDINAPSQGAVFHNLRRNVVDFDVVDPSPIVHSKSFKSQQQQTFEARARQSRVPCARTIGFTFPHHMRHHQQQQHNHNHEEEDASEECKKLECDSDNLKTAEPEPEPEHVTIESIITETISEHDHDHDSDDHELELEQQLEIVSNIDLRMKTLCKQMLQRKSALRPDCDAILHEIETILTDTSRAKYFKQCSNMCALSLPPLQVAFEDVYSLHRSQSLSASQCSSTHRSKRGDRESMLQLHDLSFCYDSLNDQSALSTRSNTSQQQQFSDSSPALQSMQHSHDRCKGSNSKTQQAQLLAMEPEWFYQASPKNVEQILEQVRRSSLQRHTEYSPSSAPETGTGDGGRSDAQEPEHEHEDEDEDEFALNLNSAFEDAKHSPLTPWSLSSLSQAHQNGIFNCGTLFGLDFDEHGYGHGHAHHECTNGKETIATTTYTYDQDASDKKEQDLDEDLDADADADADEDDDLYPLSSINEEINLDDDLTPKQLFV